MSHIKVPPPRDAEQERQVLDPCQPPPSYKEVKDNPRMKPMSDTTHRNVQTAVLERGKVKVKKPTHFTRKRGVNIAISRGCVARVSCVYLLFAITRAYVFVYVELCCSGSPTMDGDRTLCCSVLHTTFAFGLIHSRLVRSVQMPQAKIHGKWAQGNGVMEDFYVDDIQKGPIMASAGFDLRSAYYLERADCMTTSPGMNLVVLPPPLPLGLHFVGSPRLAH